MCNERNKMWLRGVVPLLRPYFSYDCMLFVSSVMDAEPLYDGERLLNCGRGLGGRLTLQPRVPQTEGTFDELEHRTFIHNTTS